MSESSFTLLREIGILPLEENEEVHFTIDAYRGFRYVSIRRYLQTDGFCGATRDGITLTPEITRVLAPMITDLPEKENEVKLGDIGKFAKRPGICVLVGLASFRGKIGLTLYQIQEDSRARKGIWLPFSKIKEIKKLFQDTVSALEEQPEIDF
jgi:hypothetical protein